MSSKNIKSDIYKAAGVDIDLAQDLLRRVKDKINATRRPEMLRPIGGFGGLFELDLSKYKNPVLVSSVDGVGTKLMVADMMKNYTTIGHDIVNHCIDDIAVQGAEPLYFMDYIGIGKLRSPLYEEILGGIAEACQASNCAVLGGETAEMPGMYGEDFDLVGSITGVVEKDKLITGEKISVGHAAVGLASNGLHTNGFSLARKVLFENCGYSVDDKPEDLNGESIGEALMKPHTCYWNALKKAFAADFSIDGIAHITGGGLYDNVPRILNGEVDVVFDSNALAVPPICSLIVDKGAISREEAYRVFNMGIGMVCFVPSEQAPELIKVFAQSGFKSAVCGKVVAGCGTVTIE